MNTKTNSTTENAAADAASENATAQPTTTKIVSGKPPRNWRRIAMFTGAAVAATAAVAGGLFIVLKGKPEVVGQLAEAAATVAAA